MSKLETQGISLHYELFGDRHKPPLMLIAGLGGTGAGWGPQIERFAVDHFVILPDHRAPGKPRARRTATPSRSTPPTWRR